MGNAANKCCGGAPVEDDLKYPRTAAQAQARAQQQQGSGSGGGSCNSSGGSSGGGNIGNSGGGNSGGGNSVTCSRKWLSHVIGSGGETIQWLRNESGASIQIDDHGER
jgi:hypothetical protein